MSVYEYLFCCFALDLGNDRRTHLVTAGVGNLFARARGKAEEFYRLMERGR